METQVFHPQETCFLLLASAAPFKGELLQSNGQAKVVQGLLGGFHPGCFPKSWVMCRFGGNISCRLQTLAISLSLSQGGKDTPNQAKVAFSSSM